MLSVQNHLAMLFLMIYRNYLMRKDAGLSGINLYICIIGHGAEQCGADSDLCRGTTG